MENPLSKLSLDYWYHVLMVVGVMVFLLTGAGLLSEFPTLPTALVSLGCFFIGLGEWVNHPLQTRLIPGGKVYGHPRNSRALGIAFDALGIALITWGLFRLFR